MNEDKFIALQNVSFAQAKALKEVGFPQEQFIHSSDKYYEPGGMFELVPWYAKPTLELVAKWLREEKSIFFEILSNDKLSGYLLFYKYKKILMHPTKKVFETYEEALSAGIDRAIERLKNNK